ncbi:hypothetical protein [Phreatobacter sp. AB_2022a]|uniref:hypothetical protein n=1 Tax=Phreatobacter sp. AB_2022a TaxID=3003134 RepID=UPI0022875B5E|nr:hypothetical protein [Phreatobacter sp. AB_2022a]MCZ0736515.1 hypothetical protein [Phreatobacter sp. AB_2022a]
MTDQRNTFSTSKTAESSSVKAHAALYTALDHAGEAPPQVVVARPRAIPQGGAAAVRALRERLIAEAEPVAGEAPPPDDAAGGRRAAEAGPFNAIEADSGRGAAGRRPTGETVIPSAAILRFRLSELPRLAGQLTGLGGEGRRRGDGPERGA